MTRSLEIIDIIRDVVDAASKDCELRVPCENGRLVSINCPRINYVFGNAQYVKDRLDELSASPSTNVIKFPLVALFCPFRERRDSPKYHSKASVSLLIACSSRQQWSNEQRKCYSFENILRPLYTRITECLKRDTRLDFGYEGIVPHDYSENYSYGRYGAHTGTGDAISEPIDAINVTNLVLTVKKLYCRTR